MRFIFAHPPEENKIKKKKSRTASEEGMHASLRQMTMIGPFFVGCVLGIQRGHFPHPIATLGTADQDSKQKTHETHMRQKS